MRNLDPDEVMRIQKEFIIFVGAEVCTIAEAEARGWVEVHADESTGEVAYHELPEALNVRGHGSFEIA